MYNNKSGEVLNGGHGKTEHKITTVVLLLLLVLALQPTVGFSLLSDSLPFRPFLTQFSPPSYSHYLYIFFDVLNPSFPWSSSVSPTCWLQLQYSFMYSFSFHPHHMTQPSHSFAFYKSHYICVFYWVATIYINYNNSIIDNNYGTLKECILLFIRGLEL